MQKDWEQSSQPAPEVTPAQKDIKQVGSELAAAQSKLNGVRKEKESLQSELAAARGELNGVRKEKESLQSELAAARDELETLRVKLEKVRSMKVAELQKTRDVIIDPKRVASVLQPLLRHADPAVRRAAVEAAGDLGSPLLVFSLIQRLNDPVGEIRHVALATLRAITGQSVVARLPEDEPVRRTLLKVLRRCWTQSGGLTLRLKQ